LVKRSIFHLENSMNTIMIKGVKENNLKNISLEIPHNKLILLTGVSGSGKTSLAYDVIFKEGQGRFLESLSSNTRHYLSRVNRPDVDEIKGLRPVISVDQKTLIRSARSTVGTLSRIYDLLRLLFAREGEQTQDITPLKQQRRLFSFNTEYGACSHCKGLGMEEVIDPNLIIKDPNLSLREGALVITQPSGYTVYSQVTIDVMNQVCQSEGFHVDIPWKDLTEAQKEIVWYGSDKIKIPFGKHSLESRMKWSGITAKPREEGYYKGIIPIMEEILKRDRNANILRFVKAQKCSTCGGQRLNSAALSILFDGKSIADFNKMSIAELHDFFKNYQEKNSNSSTYKSIQQEILEITDLMLALGLGYLQLRRESGTLSGGESQRIRLCNQIQNQLSGLLFVFDEPSIGMHSRDQQKLLKMMRRLVNNGNTVMVIEHEMDFIPAVDWIIDIGPKAGIEGGELIFNGSSENFIKQSIPNSLTKDFFLKESNQEFKKSVRPNPTEKLFLSIQGADIHNLKSIDVNFQLGALNVVCGVSGSGKSSLVMDTLVPDFAKEQVKYISQGKEYIQQIIAIDQSPIGRTPRSNPATYTKLFDHIRKLFAAQELAKQKGFGKSDFSFNVKGGRCEACQGAGYQQVGMHFIGNVEIRCEHCGGKRFQEELLEVTFQDKNIYEVLEMQVNEACEFFKEQKDIYRIVSALQNLGLGYLQLGQRATTLSGGEAQRVKLATEMSRKTKGKTLYILDEPTTGLHSYDVEILIQSLNELRELGHSIIVIEHHHHILQQADHIIELGPESGNLGGEVVFQGNYTDLLKENTLTAKALRGEFVQEKIAGNKNNLESNEIQIKGARTNNLKNIDVAIPKNKLTVITGVSGSGKSSLAFDTLFAEGRNQYLQSLPNYVRGRMNSNSQAQFESIKGLTPVIAIEGKKSNSSPRSTLGTISEVYDLFRLLFARIGVDPNGNNSQLESSAFSFNNQDAACTECKGLGEITTTDPLKLISHPEKSILDGAMAGSKTGKFYGDPNGQFVWTLKALDAELDLGLENPWQDLSEESKNLVLFGKPDLELDVEWNFTRKGKSGSHQFKTIWQGLVALIDEEYQRKHDDKRGVSMLAIMKQVDCPVCKGNRLNSKALEIRIDELNIAELSEKSIAQCINIIQDWEQELNSKQLQISHDIRKELLSRLQGLVNMELEYLQINRKASTLSGGEMQRLKIAGHIYGALSGITYVLDEPSIGLHPKNTEKLLHELERLRNLGNTVVLVEHDSDIIQAAEHLILMGPNAGANGGEVVAYGSANEVMQKHQLIGKGFKKIVLNNVSGKAEIQIKSAYANNLKNIDISIPTGELVGISGVSGSGKSSLLYEVIYRSAQRQKPVNCKDISGLEQFDEVILVNQKLEDGSSLSIPLSYLGIFDDIRKLFAKEASTKEQKVHPKIFSFNTKEGRCPHCNGQGKTKVSMDFLSDISEVCPECNGMRYHPDSLQYQLNGKNIAEVLQMTFTEAIGFFEAQFPVFQLIEKIGLGYLQLGQSLNTFSGGEAQRLKLVKQLIGGIKSKSPKLFLLDEPSRGLNFKDIEKLFYLFEILIQDGHSIIIIEHNTDMLAACHWVIELGPGGGENGGLITR